MDGYRLSGWGENYFIFLAMNFVISAWFLKILSLTTFTYCLSKKKNIHFLCYSGSFLMMLFFNRNWAGASRGRWAGLGLLAGWDAGFWIVWAEIGLLQC